MFSGLYNDIPVVAIYNNLETFYRFLSRAEDPSVLGQRRFQGDRGIFWLGSRKLVFVTAPIPCLTDITSRWGYHETQVCFPKNPSCQLSLDILREGPLIQRILDFAGPQKSIQLIPYATTIEFYQLVDQLSKTYGLQVLLPESPARHDLWVRDYIDTKAGFRVWSLQWLASEKPLSNIQPVLPEGVLCRDRDMAAGAVHWYNQQGKNCIVKADCGESSLGQMLFLHRNGNHRNPDPVDRIRGLLESNTFLGNDIVIVEELIPCAAQISPSLEFIVPPRGCGEPYIAHLANQLFTDSGYFCGAFISKELFSMPWYPPFEKAGKLIARNLQNMGYAGHFDLDAIVDDQDRLFLLEVNARRTGSTYVHEFGEFTFGPNYIEDYVLLSTKVVSEHITNPAQLFCALDDLLYPVDQENKGVVITNTSGLANSEFGLIIVAADRNEALRLYQSVLERA